MRIEIRNQCSDFNGYVAARVKSLFNVETGADFSRDFDLPLEGFGPWKVGVVVGPSGSGKTSVGRALPGGFWSPTWPEDRPIVEAFGDFDTATSALAAVGLGTVPTWLRPYSVLSNGERFRADLARLVVDAPEDIVVDEFSSVVDRQIAQVGSMAFQKAWRRGSGRAVLLTCHYDVLDWIEPDWVLDTSTGKWSGRGLHRRPKIEVDVWETDWRFWPLFEPHHYLKLPRMIAATCYVATVGGEPVAHLAVGTGPGLREARACRLVVMPEWQGAGVGMRFLNTICERWMQGENRYGARVPTMFHTSHPGLCAALRRDRRWRQVSASLGGVNKRASESSITASLHAAGCPDRRGVNVGYGGHLRAVQGFRYYGQAGVVAESRA